MTGNDTFTDLNKETQLMNKLVDTGCVSLLLVGDFLQLSPVSCLMCHQRCTEIVASNPSFQLILTGKQTVKPSTLVS